MTFGVYTTLGTRNNTTESPNPSTPVRLQDLPPEDTTKKTAALSTLIAKAQPPVLTRTPSEVTAACIGIESQPLTKELEEIKKTLQKEIARAQSSDKPKANYLIQMSKLVGEISMLLNAWSSNDSHRVAEKKKQYKDNSTKLENSSYSKANAYLISGVVGFIASIGAPLAFSIDPQTVQQVVSFGQQTWVSRIDAGAVKPGQINSLIVSELQKLNEASSSNDRLREQAMQSLNEIKQWLKEAITRG